MDNLRRRVSRVSGVSKVPKVFKEIRDTRGTEVENRVRLLDRRKTLGTRGTFGF